MKAINLLLLFFLVSTVGFAQYEPNPLHSVPYIEVTGDAEMEIVPDEIFLRFTLKERYDGKTKINLEDLEKKLKQQLKAGGFDLAKLSLADADADFVTIKRKKKDVLASKDYLLEVSSTKELSDVWEILDKIEVLNAFIQRVDHSKMEDYRKEVKIKAVQAAKAKAEYLLQAIGQNAGKALFIQERENYQPMPYAKNMMVRGAALQEDAMAEAEPEISFQKIKLEYKVFARFAIE